MSVSFCSVLVVFLWFSSNIGRIGSQSDFLIEHTLKEDDRKRIKCLVCQKLVEEMTSEILSVSSSLKYNKNGYILDDKNKPKHTPIELRKSEVFLTELMERICKKMNDYARAYHKTTGQVDVLRLVLDGIMNPLMKNYKIIKDGDMESLEFYCESIISEYEEELVSLFSNEHDEVKFKLCFNSPVCKNYDPDEDFIRRLNGEL